MQRVLTITCLLFLVSKNVHCSEEQKLLHLSKTWAERLGADLWALGLSVTRKDAFFERYNKSSSTAVKDGVAVSQELESRVRAMLQQRLQAVQRIMDAASNLAESSDDVADPDFYFYNAKNVTDVPDDPDFVQVQNGVEVLSEDKKRYLNVTENPDFFNTAVTMERSVVHVPTDVHNRSATVLPAIIWSEELDSIFMENYRTDPTLSWQYFGSSTGFMRQYPGVIWNEDPVDLFDCRTRPWYSEAASSPKDIVVLVDKSGSMKGLGQVVAAQVVHSVLESLGPNDFVNVYLFSNITTSVVPCFNNTLVQANLANVLALKEGIELYKSDDYRPFRTASVANFALGMRAAFQLLEDYRIGSRRNSGSGCNQAIMLVTDGFQLNSTELQQHLELMQRYNRRDKPYIPVRIFTYWIGREVIDDIQALKLLACENQGYYVNLTTTSDVKEKVLQYMLVMARPMVLWAAPPQPTWSPVYADVTDTRFTNHLWKQREGQEQRALIRQWRYRMKHPDENYTVPHSKYKPKKQQDDIEELPPVNFMTSISLPVYDRRNATYAANFLGVAGTDVPITHIQQLMAPHLIGVNGYAYIVTNNGHVLIHPDFRPLFQGILKPAYNRVDMVEVELPDDDLEPRDFNATILEMRSELLFQHNKKRTLDMKYHLDDMRRIMRGRRHFYYRGIDDTSFTLVVALPDKYGNVRIQHGPNEDIYLQLKKNLDVTKYFIGNKWRIHPDWQYCKGIKSGTTYSSSEEELLEFFKKILRERIQLSQKYTPCDRDLVTALVYDAKCTDFFNQNVTTLEEKKRQRFIRSLGVTIAFIATHSGLTRWQDFPQNIQPDEDGAHTLHFSEVHSRAIDEVWYRRAVEQYFVDDESFVYAVPIDVGKENNTLVTASHAVFFRKAPVAVVGHQFYHHNLLQLFFNMTGDRCSSSSNARCYLLDNHAYVVLSSVNAEETGRWLGDVDYGLLRLLVDDTDTPVYRRVRLYDYQAVCFADAKKKNSASGLFTPLKQLRSLLHWALTSLLCLLQLVSAIDPTKPGEMLNATDTLNKTLPAPCDTQRWLYERVRYRSAAAAPYNQPMNRERPYVLQHVPHTNLVLMLVKTGLKFEEEYFMETPTPQEIDYNMTLECKIKEGELPRRNYAKCINRHINESLVELCGRSSFLHSPSKSFLIAVSVLPALLRHHASFR